MLQKKSSMRVKNKITRMLLFFKLKIYIISEQESSGIRFNKENKSLESKK